MGLSKTLTLPLIPCASKCSADGWLLLLQDCPCALVDSIVATLAAAGYDPAAALATFSQEELAASLALCQDTLLAALVDAGVDTQPIFELSACADTVAALNACAAAVSGA